MSSLAALPKICKRPGCEEPQRDETIKYGPYSGLCQTHYDEQREVMSKSHLKHPQPDDANSNEESYEARVRPLLDVAKRVDKAAKAYKKRKVQTDEILTPLQRAAAAELSEFRRIIRELAE